MQEVLGMAVGGVSIGGYATCIDLPDLKVAVDLGRLIETTIPREQILITHGHADHVGALAQHVAQRGLRRLPPATYYVPPGLEGALEELLGTWRRMDGGLLAASIKPLRPGERIPLRRDLDVEPFATVHRITSQGYLFHRTRQKLLPEFEGLPGAEIAAIRQDGGEVTQLVSEPILAITGDTAIAGVLAHEEVLTAKRLVMECTFFGDRITRDESERRGHIHIEDVAAAADRFRCEAIVLNHVSPRHSPDQAAAIARDVLPPDLAARVQIWGTSEN